MQFANPNTLSYLALLPIITLFLWWMAKQRRNMLAKLGEQPLIAKLMSSVNWRGRRWRDGLVLGALGLAIFALARPQWGVNEQIVEQEGVQIMVALDISTSMLAEDLSPNRLIRARQAISDLMAQLGGDEIGLVLFSGASFIQFPLTNDYNTARTFLDAVRPGMISRPGSDLADAIETALAGFDPNRASQKVVVIMTDGGEDQEAAEALAQEVGDDGVIIYTIGFGNPRGEPIPEYDQFGDFVGHKVDSEGKVVLSKLNEPTLQRIAGATNGRYFKASTSGRELEQLVEEINRLQSAKLESRVDSRPIERYQWFLLGAVLLLVVGEWIPERRVEHG
jgi:Ca-activated chloride channel family protein